jgi:hypothetical protein
MDNNPLTLEILCAYIAHDVKIIWNDTNEVYGIHFDEQTDYTNSLYTMSSLCYTLKQKALDPEYDLGWKLLLRPLSDMDKPLEELGGASPIEWLEEKYYTLNLHGQCKRLLDEDGENWINQTEYMLVQYLLEWKFDIFGGIASGWALDLNSYGK